VQLHAARIDSQQLPAVHGDDEQADNEPERHDRD
jgi:hypothetical protein